MGEEEGTVVTKYPYTKEPIQNMLKLGSNMSITEILRDFNGWSWDIAIGEIEDLKYNILYQSLLLVDGKQLLNMNMEAQEKNSLLIQRNRKECTEFFDTLISSTMRLYRKENKEWAKKIDKIKEEKEEQLKLVQDKKAFVEKITKDKKECLLEIEKIDKISNNTDLLKEEYTKRNEKLPNKEKIFSISHLADRLEKEREMYLKQIRKYNKMIEPKEFVKEKEKIEEEVKFLQEEKDIIDCCKECLEYSKKKIEILEDRADIIRWIYKIRYYCQIPFDDNHSLKDVKKLQKAFREVIQTIIKKAQENKVWDTFTEDKELTYLLIRELFNSKMIRLENVNMICDYQDNTLYVTYYDENTMELKTEFKVEKVHIKKKIKLFI